MIDTNLKPTFKKDIHAETGNFDKGTRLVYGTSGLGGVWGPVVEEESVNAILFALEKGIKTLDTAPSYNRSQEFVGKALRQWKGEKPYVSTKVGRLMGELADDYNLDYTPEGMRKSVMNSLEILGVDSIDLLFLHEPQFVPIENIEEILEALHSFKEEGLVKKLGVGGNPVESFNPYIAGNFDVVSGFMKMDACNLSAFDHDVPFFKKNNIDYYAASALHMGLLGRRFQEHVANPPNNEWITNKDVAIAVKVNEVAEKHNIPLAELALAYVLCMEEADRVVVGPRNMAQIEDVVNFWNNGGISEEIFNEISDIILNH